jgi:hypothetical protein
MGEFMSLTTHSMRHRVDILVLIGGFIMLVDTAWGGIAALGLDLSRINELVMAISFVFGFPIYLLDLRINKRIAISMVGLFLFRWIATCFGGPTPVLCSPWRGSVLLIVAFGLLQLSKLRRERTLRNADNRAV